MPALSKAQQLGRKKTKPKKKKLPSISKLKKEADRLFSIFIRTRNLDDQGNATCFTCGKKAPWKEMQCGHFFSRSHMATRYDEANCEVQDAYCNIFRKGALPEFSMNLVRKHGYEVLEALEIRKNTIVKFTRQTYLNIIEKYK